MSKHNVIVEFVDGAEADSSELTAALRRLLADSIVFWLQAAGAHWNVEGQDFVPAHTFFGAIVDESYASLDVLAEHLRKLGTPAPSTLDSFQKLRTIEDAALRDTSSDTFIADLMRSNEVLLADIEIAKTLAKTEPGLANYLDDLRDQSMKRQWFLRSSLK